MADRRITLGEQVQQLRRGRGLTQKGLADILKHSVSWVSQVERDELPVTDTAMLQRLAAALGTTAKELVEIVLGPEAGDEERQRPYVEVLRLALAGHPAPETIVGQVVKPSGEVLARLRSETARAWKLVHASAYEELGPLLAELIRRLELMSRVSTKREQRIALSLASDVYQVAAAMLVKVGDKGAGWIAADRAISAGDRSGDSRLVMAGQLRMAHTFVGVDERTLAMHVLRQAVGGARSLTAEDDPGLVSLTGACALLLAVLEGREGNAREADRHLKVAAKLAALLGADRNDYGTEFGPTNVGVHGVHVAVELGNAADALERAKKVNASNLSPERQARLLVDVARAQAQRRELALAVSALEEAEEIAPLEVRELRLVRELVSDLEHFAGRRRIQGLTPLRQRITHS
jgi:transcriptional regulator with XRE-family HTH domain